MRPSQMTIEQHGGMYRVVFENSTCQVEITAPRDQLTGWVRQLAARLERDQDPVRPGKASRQGRRGPAAVRQ